MAAGVGDESRLLGGRDAQDSRQALGDLFGGPALAGLDLLQGGEGAADLAGQLFLGQVESPALAFEPGGERKVLPLPWGLLAEGNDRTAVDGKAMTLYHILWGCVCGKVTFFGGRNSA